MQNYPRDSVEINSYFDGYEISWPGPYNLMLSPAFVDTSTEVLCCYLFLQ